MFPRTTQVILAAEIQNRANSAPFPTCDVWLCYHKFQAILFEEISPDELCAGEFEHFCFWQLINNLCVHHTTYLQSTKNHHCINQLFTLAPPIPVLLWKSYEYLQPAKNLHCMWTATFFSCFVLCGKGLTSERCNNVTMLHCIFPLLRSWPQTIAPVICQSNCGAVDTHPVTGKFRNKTMTVIWSWAKFKDQTWEAIRQKQAAVLLLVHNSCPCHLSLGCRY